MVRRLDDLPGEKPSVWSVGATRGPHQSFANQDFVLAAPLPAANQEALKTVFQRRLGKMNGVVHSLLLHEIPRDEERVV